MRAVLALCQQGVGVISATACLIECVGHVRRVGLWAWVKGVEQEVEEAVEGIEEDPA